ncbi:MAG: hypothetical protein MJ250_00330 [Alphaproteobacteria bacterium]|nr:hypothetical protein [Alphaproteobacteria bacterium]
MGIRLTDENRLSTTYPELATEWHPTKNNGLTPNDVSFGSHRKVWWLCKKGHEWIANISNRTKHGRGCPFCSHQKLEVGVTDFESVCPEAAKEWHPTKNGNLKPSDVMFGTHKKVWWLCSKCGFEWKAEVKSRYYGCGCSRCNKGAFFNIPIVGINDLATIRSDLVKYWDFEKNSPLTPKDVTYGSGKVVWWKCKNGHEYKSSIDSRLVSNNCPICLRRRRTSFPEQAIYYYIKQKYPNAINSYKNIFDKGMELDIYIPDIKIGIEHDGTYFHSSHINIDRDSRKYEICKNNNIRLIRIAHNRKCNKQNADCIIEYSRNTDLEIQKAIISLFEILNLDFSDINIKRDKFEILQYLETMDLSLESAYPSIAAEFNIEKNNGLLPSYFHPGSNEKVWWKCNACGHEWKATICGRTRDGDGCSLCGRVRGAKKKVLYHLNINGSLEENSPELLEFWDYEKNDILPSEIIATSTKKIWWKCSFGHEWSRDLANILRKGKGKNKCPYCENKRILPGFNDLITKNPKLASEWDYKKNTDIDPTTIGAGSSKKVWWICGKCGYSWCALICSRNQGCGCPQCDNQRKRGNQYAKKYIEE